MLLQVKGKFQSLLEESKIEFQMKVEPDANFIFVDRFRIEQMLINLINNAIRFAAGKKIEVTSRKFENGIGLSVSDTGQGLRIRRLLFYISIRTKVMHTLDNSLI